VVLGDIFHRVDHAGGHQDDGQACEKELFHVATPGVEGSVNKGYRDAYYLEAYSQVELDQRTVAENHNISDI
jgi:hypothetical protein